jgi:hypothetical protein
MSGMRADAETEASGDKVMSSGACSSQNICANMTIARCGHLRSVRVCMITGEQMQEQKHMQVVASAASVHPSYKGAAFVKHPGARCMVMCSQTLRRCPCATAHLWEQGDGGWLVCALVLLLTTFALGTCPAVLTRCLRCW